MSSGKVQRGEECTGNQPVSVTEWVTTRLVFDQRRGTDIFTQPSVFTHLCQRQAPYSDPGLANVMLYNVANVRELPVPAAQVDPLNSYNNSNELPMVSNSPVGPLNTAGRGIGAPQYRVRFDQGDRVGAEIFVDGNCMLSMPAVAVDVWAVTQPLLFAPGQNGEIVQPGTNIAGGAVVESLASVAVQWGKGAGVSGPQGMATFTQVGVTNAAAPLNPIVFQRPPFARRVVGTPPATVAGIWEFWITQATPQILSIPPGAANVQQVSQDVPHAAGYFVFRPTNAVANQRLTVVWEIGVR